MDEETEVHLMKVLKNILFISLSWDIIVLTHIIRIIFGFPLWMLPKKKKSVLFMAMFFPENAGYHNRVKIWANRLQADGYDVRIKHIHSKERFEKLTARASLRSFLIIAYWKRLWHIVLSSRYEKVIVRRAIVPYSDYGKLFLEKLLLRIHPDAILDFDDDLTNNQVEEKGGSIFGKLLVENRLQFYRSLNMYTHFIAGSKYLANMVTEKNKSGKRIKIEVIPTCVEYSGDVYKTYGQLNEPITLGWIGSNFNQIYLDDITADLNELNKEYKIKLLVISGVEYTNEKAEFEIEYRTWSLETQEKDLLTLDFGLMPLRDDKMTRAKCGFKLIQYMNLGIVSVASKVTANADIIRSEKEGVLVEIDGSWKDALQKLIENEQHLPEISSGARNRIKESYSFDANYEKFKSMLS